MVAWSAQYVPSLLQAQHSIASLLGTDVMTADAQTYRMNLTQLALISMVMDAASDAAPALLTDAAWQQRLAVAIDTGPAGDRSGWPGWVLLQVRPGDLPKYGGTLTDTVPQLQAKIDAWKLAHPNE